MYCEYKAHVLRVQSPCTCEEKMEKYLRDLHETTKTMTFNYGKRGRNRNVFVDFEILVFFRNEYLDSENWRKNEKQRKRER